MICPFVFLLPVGTEFLLLMICAAVFVELLLLMVFPLEFFDLFGS